MPQELQKAIVPPARSFVGSGQTEGPTSRQQSPDARTVTELCVAGNGEFAVLIERSSCLPGSLPRSEPAYQGQPKRFAGPRFDHERNPDDSEEQ